MKKRFTLMLLAALVAVTSFAQPVKRQPLAMQQQTLTQSTPSIKPFQTVAKSQATKTTALKAKKAPKKVGLSDITWPMTAIVCSYSYVISDAGELLDNDIPYASAVATINQVDETTISIVGLYVGADEPILATVNLEDGTFEIPAGQTLMTNDTYGPVVLTNASDPEAPLTGQFYEDGSASINELWCGLLTEGDYAGYPYTNYCSTPLIAEPNGVQTSTNYSGTEENNPVFIYQDTRSYITTVFNFGGSDYASAIDIQMKEDNIFVAPEQAFVYGGSSIGTIYFSGITPDYYLETVTGVGAANVLTFDGNWCIYAGTSIYGLWSSTTITLTDGSEFEFPVIEDVPAMPADPSVIRINPYKESKGYGSIVVDVPNVDVEGNLIKEGKLFYVIYGQKDGEITKITYPADLYENLDEDLTEIPYPLNDNYDFDITDDGYKVVYLNFEFDYDTMGVQSIYYGGGEVNATEIFWYVPEPSELIEAQWVAAEQGYENTEEVTDIVISEEDGISGVFAQAEGTNAPKYYDRGEAVRIYAGNTLTISSAEYPIGKIELVLGTRTDVELTSEEGDFAVDAENSIATWEGEANEVVFDVPQGLSPAGQAYIAGINVYYAMPQLVLELIELPDGATVDEYKFVATVSYEQPVYDEETGEETGETEIVTEEVERPVFVAFVDDQVYIQGLSEVCPDGWAVGTMTDNVLTIPVEYLGEYEYIDYEAMAMYTFDMAIDKVVINYDPEKDEFTTSSLTVSAYYGGESLGAYEEYADVVITKINDVAATPADPYFTGWNLDVNETNYPLVRYEIPTVDTEGNAILTSKLAYIFWVETEEGQSQYTCVAGVYEYLDEDLTEIPSTFADNWDIYPNKLYVYTDAEDFTAWKKIGIQSVYYGGGERHESNIVWEDLTEYWEAVGIEDITAADAKSVKFYDLQGRQVTADAKGVVIRVAQMANGSTKTTKMLRK